MSLFGAGAADMFKWLATGCTILGAGMTAADLGRRATGWGFAVLATGSACWLVAAQMEQESQLGLTNLVLLVLNAAGVWRWLVRKAPGHGAAQGAGDGGAKLRPAE
ncbi:hypothetical protein [Falsiroseomonas sp. E2-1-a20]|uniref:hypothetical protein n=1 Tax=Falsiroseomonas sp. E2-1-a20 TaxID=3239300 RepID=UPI003F32F401